MNTPKMMHGTVEMVSVEWIMKNATSSIDGYDDYNGGVDYEAMMHGKVHDSQFKDLLYTIATRGFRVPIVLVSGYDGYDSDEDVQSIMHGNGHHRMCAAILFGLDYIPVYWSDWAVEKDYMCENTSESEVLREDTYGDYDLELL